MLPGAEFGSDGVRTALTPLLVRLILCSCYRPSYDMQLRPWVRIA